MQEKRKYRGKKKTFPLTGLLVFIFAMLIILFSLYKLKNLPVKSFQPALVAQRMTKYSPPSPTITPLPTDFPTPPQVPPITSYDLTQTYTNTERTSFTISYPKGWVVAEQRPINLEGMRPGDLHGITVIGAEGVVSFAWGDGFGGGCIESERTAINVAGTMRTICHHLSEDGSEIFTAIWIQRGNRTVAIDAKAVNKYSFIQNRQLILNILASIHFS
jgi:hypothetical protein